MVIDLKATLRFVLDINDVLNRDWDPIGVMELEDWPKDEYYGYAGEIAGLVRTNATDKEILDYLKWAEIENMGSCGPFDIDRGQRVLAAIRALPMSISK